MTKCHAPLCGTFFIVCTMLLVELLCLNLLLEKKPLNSRMKLRYYRKYYMYIWDLFSGKVSGLISIQCFSTKFMCKL